MQRTCNGEDLYLRTPTGAACTCGRTFDDVGRSVIYPHPAIPDQGLKLALNRELEKLAPGASREATIAAMTRAIDSVPDGWAKIGVPRSQASSLYQAGR